MDNYSYLFNDINKNVLFSTTELNDLLNKNKSIKITPHKGFVIKTYDKNEEKIYFNICYSDLISEIHLKKIVEMDDHEGLRIPLSIGNYQIKIDKNGNKYKTIDIILNTKLVNECKKNMKIKKVVAELVQIGVNNKYKLETCSNLFFFPKHKYKGSNPADQYIKDDQQHKMSLLDEDNEKKLIEQDIHNYFHVKKPNYGIWFIPLDILKEKIDNMKNDFYIPYLRNVNIDGIINAFDYLPPFLNYKKNKKNESFKFIFDEYNENEDEILSYSKIIDTVCVIQIPLPYLILAEYNKKNNFDIKQYTNIYINDENVSLFFKNSPDYPTGYNPPYKNIIIRFPYYLESSLAIAQYVENIRLLNIIIPVNKKCNLSIFNKLNENHSEIHNYEDVFENKINDSII